MANFGEITVTVVTGIYTGQIDLSHEVAMVKAGLLYGDKVRLVSLQGAAVSTIAGFVAADGPARKQLLEQLVADRDPVSAAAVESIRRLRAKRGKTPKEIIDLKRLDAVVERAGARSWASMLGILEESRVAELVPALKAGVLTLHPLGLDEGKGIDDGLVNRWAEVLSALVERGSNAFPFLDDDAGRLARTLAKSKGQGPPAGGRVQEVRLAGDLIASLPAFPEAPMGAVLEAREALAVPLMRFRSALLALAKGIEEFPGDPEFEVRVADLWRSDVQPALEDLKEAERQRGVRQLLLHSASETSLARVAEAGVGVFSMATNAMPGLVGAAVAAAGDVLATAMKRRRELGEEMSRNRFLLLYEADKRLAQATR